MSKYNFRCRFCGTGFIQEHRYINHICNAMRRDKEIRTPLGQAAWNNYRLWMTEQRRNVPTLETFLDSKFYTTFINFTKRAKEIGIPNTTQYIKYMIRQGHPPVIWMNDVIYNKYLQYLDRGTDPTNQVEHTVNYLFKIADALECDVSEVFDRLQADDVIHMLRQRKLSPWILLHSKKFKEFYSTELSTEQRMITSTIINRKIWSERCKENPTVVNQMKDIVRELNL